VAVLDVARALGGPAESTLLGSRAGGRSSARAPASPKVGAPNAVLANATLAHGLDFDDTREDAIVHTSCVAVTTAITASFAAAAAAGSQASGIIEYLADGSWTKRLHPGWNAHAGVIATRLARAGFTGPASVFEGTHGFYLIASILVRGRAGLAEFTDTAVHDPSVLRVAKLVTYELDPTIDYPRQFVGDVAIRLADGRVLHARQDRPRGGPDAPLARAELEAKFRGDAAIVLPDGQAGRVIQHVHDLVADAPLAGLLSALTVEETRK
jgi:2-methylcitrate dehydratase PrpD